MKNERADSQEVAIRFHFARWIVLFLVLMVGSESVAAQETGGADFVAVPAKLKVVSSEFVFDQAPHPSCHASMIAETDTGLIAAWFGGKREGDQSVGIWSSMRTSKGWSQPKELVNGIQKDGTRFPCWNPVLFSMDSHLYLFYKVGPNPRQWWGMMIRSSDQGRTWSQPKRLKDGILGPIKNKPVQLMDGRLLAGSSTEHAGWKVHLEWTSTPWDVGSWQRSKDLSNEGSRGAIQPAILTGGTPGLRILCRNQERDSILTSVSKDGKKWSPLVTTELPNPNSGIDAVSLDNGQHLVVYNHTRSGRSPLNIAVSTDGVRWKPTVVLEDEPRQEFSYPAVIQTADGQVHVTYTWKRKKIKHVVLRLVRGK